MQDINPSLARLAQQIALQHYGIEAAVSELPGEIDFNFLLQCESGEKFILKMAHAAENHAHLELQHAVLEHLSGNQHGLVTSKLRKTILGASVLELDVEGAGKRLIRVLTWIEGRVFAKVNPHSPALLERLGRMCGTLCLLLQHFDHPAAHRFLKWDPSKAIWIRPHLSLFTGERAELVHYFFALFEQEALPMLPELRMSINYNDANDYNVLASEDPLDPVVPGVIDFGDLVYTHTVNELAIAIAYAVMDKEAPLEAACHIVKGFHQVFPLTKEEIRVLYYLIAARLLISVTCSALNLQENPENEYLQISDRPAWDLLTKLRNIHPSFAEASFRHACGLEPSSARKMFDQWIDANRSRFFQPVGFSSHSWLDLGIGSLDLGNYANLGSLQQMDRRISGMVQEAGTETVLGKYNEARAVYTSQGFEMASNEGPQWRTVHIGIDYFNPAGTEVRAVFDGVIHGFANNTAERDYGPTIIIQHEIEQGLHFYTLYGHLDAACLEHLNIGKAVKAGERIARVGTIHENGGWTPHLHFQVMLDCLGKQGDFPGVCVYAQLPIWTSICPDPWWMLTGTPCPGAPDMANEEILAFRKEHLGKNLSVSYRQPIQMVRGAGAYLIDHTGRNYLDTVNNVAHVGHEHPRVVLAGQRQMAVLNTNTRYLHRNLVGFVDELIRTLPPSLDVAFLVNSGSEANELAMRLAKNYTGQEDMIVSEIGYHGNTNACVDISSYKFDGPGGKGAKPFVHVVPIPDTYRGLYRDHLPDAGYRYAQHVQDAVKAMAMHNRKPAALIFESVISCGGQVVLPPHFLEEAYRYTRAAGGLCVADEVQTGCGRAGDHFWAFQAHGVVPDIVTIGKPIGNGHPLGVVVTTQAIANAFKNGMEYFNTFGGNPVSCAIGREVLQIVKEEGLQEHARMLGAYLTEGLRTLMQTFPVIGDVRGPGLFIGIELVETRNGREPATARASYFANRMRDKGILMSTDGPFNNVLKIKPPMVMSMHDADLLLETAGRTFREDMMRIDQI